MFLDRADLDPRQTLADYKVDRFDGMELRCRLQRVTLQQAAKTFLVLNVGKENGSGIRVGPLVFALRWLLNQLIVQALMGAFLVIVILARRANGRETRTQKVKTFGGLKSMTIPNCCDAQKEWNPTLW